MWASTWPPFTPATPSLQWGPTRRPGCGQVRSPARPADEDGFNGARPEGRDVGEPPIASAILLVPCFNGARPEGRDVGSRIGQLQERLVIALQWGPTRRPGCGVRGRRRLAMSGPRFNGARPEGRDVGSPGIRSAPTLSSGFNGARPEGRDVGDLNALQRGTDSAGFNGARPEGRDVGCRYLAGSVHPSGFNGARPEGRDVGYRVGALLAGRALLQWGPTRRPGCGMGTSRTW